MEAKFFVMIEGEDGEYYPLLKPDGVHVLPFDSTDEARGAVKELKVVGSYSVFNIAEGTWEKTVRWDSG